MDLGVGGHVDEYDRAKLELHKAESNGTWADVRYWSGYVDALKYMLKRAGAGSWDFELAEERLKKAVASLG